MYNTHTHSLYHGITARSITASHDNSNLGYLPLNIIMNVNDSPVIMNVDDSSIIMNVDDRSSRQSFAMCGLKQEIRSV